MSQLCRSKCDFTNCNIYNNTATSGGGICIYSGTARLANSQIYSNTATRGPTCTWPVALFAPLA